MTNIKSKHYPLLLTMPKVELHLHLEGSIQPTTLLELARKHAQLDNLPGQTEASLRQWFHFTDFRHFIEIYTTISDLLRTPDDFAHVATMLAAELARQNVRYAEVTFTPYTHTHLLDKGISIDDIFVGLDQGRQQARSVHGVEIAWVFDIARNFSFNRTGCNSYDPRPAEVTLEYALQGQEHHGVIGLGLGGDEVGAPPGPFAHVFNDALRHGLISVPHAGELEGPSSVWGAIYALGAQRIGHGVHAIEDPLLLAYLHQHRIPLEINLTSNQCLHIYKKLGHHPFPHLDRMGIIVTVNSDDPPLFNTDLTHEYTILMDEFGYDLQAVARIACNAFQAASLQPARRAILLAELDSWVSAHLP